jgi:hypothetical protein
MSATKLNHGEDYPWQKKPVDAIYSQGRNGAPVVPVKIKPPKWELDPKGNSPECRFREDAPAPDDGEVARNWLRGYGYPPHFDRSKAGR